jgi:nucleoside-diphosphate-sugar epimerase
MRSAFVTGGSGYLGRNLLRRLSRDGISVRALARSTNAAATVQALGATAVRGDLDDQAVMAQAMHGCDAVFHVAASVSQWKDEAGAYAANVLGTANALAAARAAGVKRFIHVSTEAVLAAGKPIVQADERVPRPKKPIGLYPRTKGLAEERVLAANSPELATIVVRPRLIWGNDDTTLLPAFADAVRSGRFMWFDGGHFPTSTCHVENVCAGMLAAAERGRGGEIYFLTDGEPVEVRDFLTRLLATRGIDPGGRSIPRWVGELYAGVNEWIWRTFKLRGAPLLTRAELNLFGNEMTVRDDKARRELGYKPVVTIEQGLAALQSSAQPANDDGKSVVA